MTEENVLIVGLGEVGRPLFELLKESGHFAVYGFDINEEKMSKLRKQALPDQIAVMHICIPCPIQEVFIKTTVEYVKRFKPKLVIINSTVPPGTTMTVYRECAEYLVAHSPVRGVHTSLEHMKWELKRWTKYVGGANPESGVAARRHFNRAGLETKVLKTCLETELAKLFETTYRAWMIACFQEMHRISRHFDAEYDEVIDFLADTHRIRMDRPIMFPGVIGGHCLIPNTELLSKSYDSQFLRLILESNDKRKEEIKDVTVMTEVEKAKHRAKILEEALC